jgi:plastocyanin
MPHEQAHGHLRAYLILLVVLLAAVSLVVFIGSTLLSPRPLQQAQEMTAVPKGFPADAPVPTAQDTVVAQQGFNYIVAYTDQGFRPATLSVKKGQVIRFTNIAAGTVQITASSESSPALAHAQYWEYTAKTAGTVTAESSNGQSFRLVIK